MTAYQRILFYVSTGWVILCIFVLTAGQFLPFRFVNPKMGEAFAVITWLTFPLAVLLTGFKHSEKNNISFVKWKIAVSIVAFFFLGVNACSHAVCDYSTEKVVFINKFDNKLKIVRKDYGCGAWDSSLPKNEFFQTKRLTKQLLYSAPIDTLDLDKNEWLMADSE